VKVSSKKKKGGDFDQYEQRFKVMDENPIGAGSFGRTFLGVDLKKEQRVAIKVVRYLIECKWWYIDGEEKVDGLIFERSYSAEVAQFHRGFWVSKDVDACL